MTLTAKTDLSDTVEILAQLDKQSLLLIDSGARLLAARLDMDRDARRDQMEHREAETDVVVGI